MELDMQEMIAVMANPNFKDEHEIVFERKTLHRSVDSMLTAIGVTGEKIPKNNLQEIWRDRVRRVTDSLTPGIQDGLLYGIASSLGKDLSSINDAADELAMRLGEKLLVHQALATDNELRNQLNKMVRLYNQQELTEIAECVDCGSEVVLNKEGLLRNRKMSFRMDSMMKLQSWFFAVAVAQLPGDHGIINQLRGLGYKLEPVFSPTTLNVEAYYEKVRDSRWRKVTEPGFYSIDLPGEPLRFDFFGPGREMKILYDVPTSSFYMFGYALTGRSDAQSLMETFKQMVIGTGGNVDKLDPKVASIETGISIEDTFYAALSFYKMRLVQKDLVTYMIIYGHPNDGAQRDDKEQLRYFNSFVSIEQPKAPGISPFSIAKKGFSLLLPGKPKPNLAMDKQMPGPEWKYTTYDLVDPATGLYYFLQIQELTGKTYIEGDTMYYHRFLSNLSLPAANILEKRHFEFQGWPAFTIKFRDSNGNYYKIFNVLRGNRIYHLLAAGRKEVYDEIEKTLSTFKLEDLPVTRSSTYKSEGFVAFAPQEFVKQPALIKPNSLLDEATQYFSFDHDRLLSYEVYKVDLLTSPHRMDDFLVKQMEAFKQPGDVVRLKKSFSDADVAGLDFELQKPGSNRVRKFRLLVKNHILFIVHSPVPENLLAERDIQAFFTDFRITE